MTALGAAPDVKLAEVKWRVQGRPTNSRAQFVPYVDAVIVAALLDEWVGSENWQDDYIEPGRGKGLWGRIGIKVGDEWVWKTDKGVPSNMESEKGEVSDAFKRVASIKWGVARNVYRLPTLWAPCDERTNNKNEKVAYPNDKTIPAIIAELKKRGYSDAAAADATADHDEDEPSAPPACPRCGEVVPAAPDDREPMRAHLVAEHGFTRQDDGTVVAPKIEEPQNLESPAANPSFDDAPFDLSDKTMSEGQTLADRASAMGDKVGANAPRDVAKAAAGDR